MKKLLIAGLLILTSLSVMAVEQRYMPDGYVRDDVIYPYYAEYTSRFFKKVEKGETECTWANYRRQVEAPMRPILERYNKESRQGLYPKNYSY
jgi:hypothetical protein